MSKKIFLILITLISLFLLTDIAKAQPATISDLSCRPDTSAGAVWLVWTVPLGVASSSAYDIRFVQGNTINFDTAIVFSQSWPTGLVGFPKQELVTGLNQGTQFTFAIKSRDASGNWSTVSNQATCFAPTSTGGDKTPPQSFIIKPGYNATVPASTTYVIEGRALDRGGSSVQKVEISFDNAKSWSDAKITDVSDINYLWQYVWLNPAVGQYKIQTRATDWMGNVESPGLGTPVQVVSPSAAVEKPAPSAASEDLKTKIADLQIKITELLRQLIAIYQNLINQISAK